MRQLKPEAPRAVIEDKSRLGRRAQKEAMESERKFSSGPTMLLLTQRRATALSSNTLPYILSFVAS
jgi:hypothetical protein